MDLSVESRCIHILNDNKEKRYGAISFPIYQTATFAHPGLGQSTGYDYSRVQNPTREQLEKVVASLEMGKEAIAFSTGMAALLTVMELFKPGDHLIVDSDLYGGSTRLFKTVSEKNGIEFTAIDFSSDDVRSYIRDNTKAFFIETPTNPMMNITDIKATADIAHEIKALLIVDNTFLSPYLQNPLTLGADIVIHSGTKYLSGHNDTLSGFVVANDDQIIERLRFVYKTIGVNLSPFDSWLVLRGIQTLAVRMDRAQENALKIAEYLKTNPRVKEVYYPGLKEHKGYEIHKKQSRGAGAMLTFNVDSFETVDKCLRNIKLIQYAESLGGTESLLTYPLTQTHADVPREILEKNGLKDTTIRMSVGIENVDDLIYDLEQALS
ncbi:MAG: PLP-dependent aspartate aminotransferase family protein [Lachnospiraceae bacterium]|nr:PLP-dependent aspartate aminotransferase family protein [Lachnospiraceae bacterium]